MFRLALNNAIAHRSRFALTALAVVLSVAFLTATLILSASIDGTAAEDIAAANAGLDAVVEGTIIAEDEGGPDEGSTPTRQPLPDDALNIIKSTPGVADSAAVTSGFAKLVCNGVALGSGAASDVGIAWIDNQELNPFALVDGSAPVDAGDIVIDRRVANDENLSIGDSVQLLTGTGVHDVTITGFATFGGAGSAPLQRTTLFAASATMNLLGSSDTTQILVDAEAGTDPAQLTASLAEALPTAEVSTGAAYIAGQQSAATSAASFYSVFLLSFAVIATIVGISIIYNTFVIAVAHRRQELALLRAIGAERRQVLRSVMAEAILVGLVATAIGIGVGLASVNAMRTLMSALGLSFLDGPTVISPVTLLIAGGVGVITTLLSAWFPARSAASTPPIDALREAKTEHRAISGLRATVGLTCLGIGVAALFGAVIASNALFLAAAGLLVPGLMLAGPVLVHAAVRIARPALRGAAGIEGTIATTNLDRSPRRASSTSLALSLGVALVAFFAILASSLSAAVTNDVSASLNADHVITSVSDQFSSIDPGLHERVAAIDGVTTAAAVAQAEGAVDANPATIGGIDADVFVDVYDLDVAEGSLADLASGGIAVVEAGTPTVSIGQSVTVEIGAESITAPVVAIVSATLGGFDAPTHFMDADLLAATSPGLLDTVIFVNTDGRAASDHVRDVVAASPGSLVDTRSGYLASQGSEIDDFRNFIFAMLGLTVIIALVGIANTTTLSIAERTREIGLLRAIGTTSASVRVIILLEAALLAVVGTLVGLAIALGLGWALVAATGGSDLPSAAVPWLTLSVIGVGALLAGVLSAVYPAWRASRRDVLSAIAA